jgi:hypothetical protein
VLEIFFMNRTSHLLLFFPSLNHSLLFVSSSSPYYAFYALVSVMIMTVARFNFSSFSSISLRCSYILTSALLVLW